MPTPSFSYPTFSMRAFALDDSIPLHKILGDPDVIRYMPFKSQPSLEKVQKLVCEHIAHWDKFGYGWWALESNPDYKFIGWCGLEYLPELDETEVGYLLAKDAWGKGIATQAVKTSLKFAFTSAGLQRIIGLVHPQNIASIRVLEKNGLAKTAELDLWSMHLVELQISSTQYNSSSPLKLS